VAAVREGSFQFRGVTAATMSHGEGLAIHSARQVHGAFCALPVLLDCLISRRPEKPTTGLGGAAVKLRRF